MSGIPERTEAAPYYYKYIDRIESADVVGELARQLDETHELFGGISEEKSRHRYAADKWSVREVLSHVNDTERVFLSRALWFARGLESELPSYDQDVALAAARSDEIPWARHVEEFRAIRGATLAFFRNLPEDAWTRRGIASGNPFTVRALAFITAGHLAHHLAILEDKYLSG